VLYKNVKERKEGGKERGREEEREGWMV